LIQLNGLKKQALTRRLKIYKEMKKMTTTEMITIIVFVLTMTLVITERVHRAVAALSGAVLLMALGVLSIDECVSYIDVNTIGVLTGMMLFVAVVKSSGIFEFIAIWAAKKAKGEPWLIMLAFIVITALLSAFLDNVTTVLLIGPMTLAITRILDVNPIPYIMSQILASNVGGTATLIGDPPNIMIGSAANLSFVDFLTNTGIVAVLILIVYIAIFYFIYGKEMAVDKKAMEKIMELDEKKAIKDKTLVIKSVIIMLGVALGFIFHSQLGIESAVVALSAAAIMLIIGKQDAEDIILSVEWSTIIFFLGLFVVVGGLEKTGVINTLANGLIGATQGNLLFTTLIILWISAIASAFLDNIPFVATMIPLILAIEAQGAMDVSVLWWALSLGACLGGNGSLVGASANVVLSGISTKNGYPITFKSFIKIGFPMMIVSIVISTVFLVVMYL